MAAQTNSGTISFANSPRDSAAKNVPWFYRPEIVGSDGASIEVVEGPSGMDMTDRGVVKWLPQETGTTNVTLRASDSMGGSIEVSFVIEVNLLFDNETPAINIDSLPTHAAFGANLQYSVMASDLDNDVLQWSLEEPPEGMSINEESGVIDWVPDVRQLGTHSVSLLVSDPYGATAFETFDIEVSCENASPSIHSTPVTNAAEQQVYRYELSARDPEGDPLSYVLTDRPDGMTVDNAASEITWVPRIGAAGIHHVEVVVRDSHGNLGRQMFDIEVDPLPPGRSPAETLEQNQSPRITSTPVFGAASGEEYRYAVVATDPEDDAVTFGIEQGPDGMEINSSTGLITWDVGAKNIGENSVHVVATDSLGATAKQFFTLSVAENAPPRIFSVPPTTSIAGSQYEYQLRVSDPDSSVLFYSLEGPSGMSISRSGLLQWSSSVSDAGSNVDVVVTVSDEHGDSDTQTFSVSVINDEQAPAVDVRFGQGIVDTNGHFFLSVGQEPSVQVVATDNIGVISTTLSINGETVNLSANGIGRYLPSAGGNISVDAIAVDAAGNVGTFAQNIGVIDQSDQNAPTIEISSPARSKEQSEVPDISTAVDVIGSVDDENLNFWKLEYSRAKLADLNNLASEGSNWVEIGRGTSNVENGNLGTFDATVIANDSYIIRLYALDVSGNINVRGIRVTVSGELKIGNFRLDFTDLQIPLAGIPVEIKRTYDTLDANVSGSFGFGWSMGAADPLILETVADGQEFVHDQTKVYLTNPDGRRVGFTYQETAVGSGLLGDTAFDISFKPDPGVYDTLSIVQDRITRGGISGVFGSVTQALGAVLMNPSEYTLTTKEGLVYRYHEDDGLNTVTDLNGNTLTYTENAITHSSGLAVTFVRDAQGRVDEIQFPGIDHEGYTTTEVLDYDYNTSGDLTSFTNAVGQTVTYAYEDSPAHYLKEASRDEGHVDFRVVYEIDNATNVQRFKHVEDANGNTLQLSERPDLDARRAVVRDGNGNETLLHFDERGNVEREIDALGNETIRKYEDSNNPDLETEVIDRRGFVATREYDSRGNVLFIRELGHKDDLFAEPIVTSFTYDSGNRIESITNAKQQETIFEYDSNGNLERIINPVGDVSVFTYDVKGRRESFTDFNGNTTTFAYESGDQPSRATFADGTYQALAYNQFGQVTSEQFFEADGMLVEQKSTFYDASGRVTHEFDGEKTDDFDNQLRRFYDSRGNLDWEIIVSPDSVDANGNLAESPLTEIENRKSRITDFQYDNRNRLIQRTDAEGGVVRFRYDNEGNRLLLQDPVGNITTWVYDSLNRVVEERDPFYWEKIRAADSALASLSNEDFLSMIAPIDPSSVADPLYDDPSGASCENDTGANHIRLTCYDQEGNRTKTIDRNGRRREFNYDHSGRLEEERWYNASGHSSAPNALVETITFSYDPLGNMETASDSNSNYLFTYDTLNRMKSVDNNPDGTRDVPRVVLTYEYDKQGNVISTSDDAGVTVESNYDMRNRLEWRKWFDADGSGDVDDARVDFKYNAAGRESLVSRYSDLNATTLVGTTHRTYDLSGRSDLLNHLDAVESLIAGYDYGHDYSGLLNTESRTHQDAQFRQGITYAYDLTGQLTEASFSGQDDESYSYDLNGNRESSLVGTESRAYTIDTANQLESDGQFSYEYDGEGNLVKRVDLATGKTRKFGYDHRNRLAKIDDWSNDPDLSPTKAVKDQGVQYASDSFDRRVKAGEEHITYNGNNLWHVLKPDSATRFLFGTQIDKTLAQMSERSTAWYLADQVGTIRDVLHGGIASFGYQSFGGPLSTPDRFGFTSREYETDTGLYYFRTRTLDPEIGRFLSPDTVGFSEIDFNLYRYATNNPIDKVDPTGTTPLVGYLFTAIAVYSVFEVAQEIDCNYNDSPFLCSPDLPGLPAIIAPFGFALADYFARLAEFIDGRVNQPIRDVFNP